MHVRQLVSALVLVSGSTVFGIGIAIAQERDQDRVRAEDTKPDQDRAREQDRDRDRLRDPSVPAQAGDRIPEPGTPQVGAAEQSGLPARERVYGWELMTAEERDAHRQAMRAAKTAAAREQLRKEHRLQMEERARQRNVQLREPHWMDVEKPGPRNQQER